jgi:biotin-dependent carboxylase-like uncharacterized protein
LSWVAVGDRGLLLTALTVGWTGALADAWRAQLPAGVTDVVAGQSSVLLIYEPGNLPAAPAALPPDAQAGAADSPTGRPWLRARPPVVLPVAYDGADLAETAARAGVDPATLAARHAAPLYRVDFVGFSPGFAYLSGGAPDLAAVPRRDHPRVSVPAGSVAVADGLTAVYPQATPGGWHLLGRTDAALFDPTANCPALLAPGDRVRFAPSASVGSPPAWPRPRLLPDPAGPRLEVLDVGGRLTVQDGGRRGWAHCGVPRAGAADSRSAAAANALVGNRPDAPLLEATLGGCRVRLAADRVVAVAGAPAPLVVGGLPARAGRALPVPAGTEILLGRPERGVHTYLAVAGGIDIEVVLGSASTDTLSGLGPPPLQPGDTVGLTHTAPSGTTGPGPGPTPIPAVGETVEVVVRPGPAARGSGRTGFDRLAAADWVVSPDADRTGIRLAGPHLAGAGRADSTGLVPGALQLPPGGQPVVLLRNHPTTGGYPVVAVVDDAGVDRLAQCRPGQSVRFRPAGPS